jgi:hypothetical protein
MFLLIAAEAAAATPETSIWIKLAIGAGLAIAIAAVVPVSSWLKKQKIVQKYHLGAHIDRYADRLTHYLEDLQKEQGVTGPEALKIGMNKVKEKFGIGETEAEEAMRAAYTKGKRVKDAAAAAAANANFPTPPGEGS